MWPGALLGYVATPTPAAFESDSRSLPSKRAPSALRVAARGHWKGPVRPVPQGTQCCGTVVSDSQGTKHSVFGTSSQRTSTSGERGRKGGTRTNTGLGPVSTKQLGRYSQRTTVGTGRTRGGVGRHILLGMHCLSQGHDHPVPCKVYARLEANEEVDSEQPAPDREQARSTLIAYDAVSADWIDSRQESFFVFDEGLERRVNAYWGGGDVRR